MLVWGAALICGVSSVHAGEVDLLIQKLVEKNVLSANEAQILLDDTRQEVAKQNAKGINEMLPAWVQTTKIKGDLRLRYQTQQREAGTVRNRGRVRYRLGVETKPNDKVTVAAGLASAEKQSTCTALPCTNGVDDSRSTNTTMQNTFDRGAVRLDYAYGQFKPNTSMMFIGGKYNALGTGALWYTTDMMWDSDINQEGASARMDILNVLGGDLFASAGYWVLDESSGLSGDPGMYYAQAGMTFPLSEPVTLKMAGTLYGVEGVQDRTNPYLLEGRATGNTVSGSRYVYDFDRVYAGSIEAVYKFPEETSSPIKMVGLFADYVNNPDPSDDNIGYAAGFKFGHNKVGAAKGDWQFKYQYVNLERDAWLDAFPDSDRYSGNTNIKGHELILDIGLSKNVSLGLDYYRSQVLEGTALPEHIFQADINMKF